MPQTGSYWSLRPDEHTNQSVSLAWQILPVIGAFDCDDQSSLDRNKSKLHLNLRATLGILHRFHTDFTTAGVTEGFPVLQLLQVRRIDATLLELLD